jgi:AcrR family transcriptional regulator
MIFDQTFEHSEALHAAALHEFIERGYEQASINTILKAAGMSKGQFYYHFENKAALYFSLIEQMIARKREFLESVMQAADFQGDIFDIFAAQMRYSAAFTHEYPMIGQFAERFVREQGSAIYEKALARYDFRENEAINQLIDAAYARGDFRDDLPRSFITKTLGYLFTHAADLAALDDMETLEANMSHLIAFMKDGLARRP